MTYDDHKTQPLKPVARTNHRLGVEDLGMIDRFWASDRRGLRYGQPLATIQARPFEVRPDFELTLLQGPDAGVRYQSEDYNTLLNLVRLAYDSK
jgi:hypothetical protein